MAQLEPIQTNSTNPVVAAQNNPQTDPPAVVKEKEGRSYSDISKKVAKNVGIALLVVAAVIATAVLVTALLPYMLPAGVAIGAAFQAAGTAIGAYAATVVTWITANSTIMIIASSIGLGAIAIGGVAACIVKKCKKNEDDVELTQKGSESDESKKPATTTVDATNAAPVQQQQQQEQQVTGQSQQQVSSNLTNSQVGTPVRIFSKEDLALAAQQLLANSQSGATLVPKNA